FALVLLSLLKFTLFSGLPPALAILSFAVFAAILKFGFGFNLDQLKTLAKNTRALLNFSKKKPVLKFEPSPLRPGTEWHLRIENLSTENANSAWNFRIRQFEQISRTIEKKTYRRRISYTIYESFIEADILVPKESVHRELNSCSFTIKDELSQSLYT